MPEAQGPIDPVSDIEELATKVRDVVGRATIHELGYEGIVCPMCFERLTPEVKDDPDAIYHEVVSWVTGPKLQSPVLRSQTGRIAHKTCIDKLLNGQSPDQEAIPGLEEV